VKSILEWFDLKEPAEIGLALADQMTLRPPESTGARATSSSKEFDKALRTLVTRVDREVVPRRWNFFKRAKLANAFKWRLLDKGVENGLTDQLTQALVLQLSGVRHTHAPARTEPSPEVSPRRDPRKAQGLFAAGKARVAAGDHEAAVALYEESLTLDPKRTDTLIALGDANSKLGRHAAAEELWRRAIARRPNDPAVYTSLGRLLSERGSYAEAENLLRRALALQPDFHQAQITLASTLVIVGKLAAADEIFEKVLRGSPRNPDALIGKATIAERQGRFDDAERLFIQARELDPDSPVICEGLIRIRRMTEADRKLLKRAEIIASSGIAGYQEAALRFAIGKSQDDLGEYAAAFQSFRRGNDLLKEFATPYDRTRRTRLVDDLIRVHTKALLSRDRVDGSSSRVPILVVGMMRSGTSLAEQILATHPMINGAGELTFWSQAFNTHEAVIRRGPLPPPMKGRLIDGYLQTLSRHADAANHVIDKNPFNSDFLGPIHCLFPGARFIYMKRHPIDVCLSVYFQRFAPSLNFSMDLGDLAHYYFEHHRLMEHWRAVLPPGTLLEVPYEELVADQEGWTRKILDFLGLDWDERCRNFHETERPVMTASFWQVRQRMYDRSVARWRHYEKFLGPLRDLKRLA